MERVHSLSMMSRSLLRHCLILISLFIAAATANTSTTTADQDGLLALKAHITHDPTNFLAKNWNTRTLVCNWTGVTCDVHSHRVTILNISRLNLTGTIPSQLGNLSSLQSLDLSFNQLSGSIPSAIFSIYTLKYVNFRENQLSGAFPSLIFNKSSLQLLDFAHNTLSDEIPANICSNLPFLEILSLSQNMFHGGIPSTLSNCTYLQKLSLPYNDFSGAIPKEIGNLNKLKRLYLGRNRLQGEIPQEFGNLAELEQMSLSENKLQGKIPQNLGNLAGLEILQLFGNFLTGEIPQELVNLTELEKLSLSNNFLTGEIARELGNLTELEKLWLDNNFLTEYGREGRVSTNGDVYSFGIMLIEAFTRKKPTDEMFSGEMTLKRWINDLLSVSVMEVVDANLLTREDRHFAAKQQCVSFVFNLAMECTIESPERRINAKEIVTELSKIRDSLFRNVGADE